jgi:hypothetical protein
MHIAPANDHARLDDGDLYRMFEESEDASLTARKEAERDRNYVDGKQITADELAELAARPAAGDRQLHSSPGWI